MIKKYIIVILLTTILFRFIFVLTYINHECANDNDETCHICLIINNYKKDIEKINPYIPFLIVFLMLILINNKINLNSCVTNDINETLIELKVELNN